MGEFSHNLRKSQVTNIFAEAFYFQSVLACYRDESYLCGFRCCWSPLVAISTSTVRRCYNRPAGNTASRQVLFVSGNIHLSTVVLFNPAASLHPCYSVKFITYYTLRLEKGAPNILKAHTIRFNNLGGIEICYSESRQWNDLTSHDWCFCNKKHGNCIVLL